MINFNKKDPVADIIRGIMEKELKGNQTKLDKNHNGKLDGQDFAKLRAKKEVKKEEVEQVDEISKSTLGSYVKKASLNRSQLSYGSGLAASRGVTDTKGIEKDSQRAKGISKAVGRLTGEEVESIDEISTKTLAGAAKAASDPDSDYYYGKSHDAQKFVDHAKKTKDAKSAAAVQGAADKSHYPRDNHTSGYDKLTYRTPPRVTAAGKANKQDIKALKTKLKEEVEPVEENAFDYKSPRQPEPNGGSGVKKGARYGGSKQKEKPEQEEPKEKMTLKKMKEGYEEPILDELINEVLSKDADAGDWIHDFVHSDNPKFEGKSTVERKKMALGAYYAKQDEEAVQEGYPVSPGWPAFKKKKAKEPVDAKDSKVQEGLKSVVKKTFKALTGGSDEDQRKNLQKKMGVPETGKKPTKEEVVVEGRQPTSQMDTPFVTDAENKPLGNAKELAAKTMKRMKNEMLGKTGTSE